jgi:hypothetical protein
MTKLEQIILDSRENDNFFYSGFALKKILKDAEYWKEDRLEMFKTLLRRIKRGRGIPDHNPDNKEGMYVSGPAGKSLMTIFFTKDPTGYYRIYDFKLE